MNKKFEPGPGSWRIHEWDSCLTIRDGKTMVCRCTKNAEGKKYAKFLKTAPEMYAKLVELEAVLRPTVPVLADDIAELLKNARGESYSIPSEKGNDR